MWGWPRRPRRLVGAIVAVGVVASLAGTALAHGGGLRSASAGTVSAPTWLVVLTGGGVVAGSFLLATFVTDRRFVTATHEWRRRFGAGPATDAAASVARGLGVLTLLAVILAGLFGPSAPLSNLAILVVWVGWWSGFTATTYLVGNTWPVLNPWRTLTDWLSLDGLREYPDRLGMWPAVVGLLGLIFVEVVSPLADDPPLLAGVVLAYSVATLVGAALVGREQWFDSVDPVGRAFATYGRLAPITYSDDGLAFRLPGAGLTEPLGDRPGTVAFVVALLWATTYDGVVATPAWASFSRWVVALGVPPLVVYLSALIAGFVLFYGAFVAAARRSRSTGDTYLTPDCIARWFAPSLIPIAAGYHLAHFLGYVLSLSPALVGAILSPFDSATAMVLVLPGWFGGLELWFVLAGHLLAVGVAHAVAYRLFPSRLQAVRSQYPFVLAMVVYTTVSLWIVSRPSVTPPFL